MMSAAIFITALAIAFAIAPLGCFVVWRRMAYFGDALSHSALLGVGAGLVAGITEQIAIVVVALIFVLAFIALRRNAVLTSDTILGVLAHASLAGGILIFSFVGATAPDMHDYLFGSLTSLSNVKMAWIIGLCGGVVGVVLASWHRLLLITHSEELARAEGVSVAVHEFLLMAALAVMVAVTVQIIGVLPITALLIIPAAAAQIHAKSPEATVFLAILFAAISMLGGLSFSLNGTIASGPPMVAIAVAIFAISLFVKMLVKRLV